MAQQNHGQYPRTYTVNLRARRAIDAISVGLITVFAALTIFGSVRPNARRVAAPSGLLAIGGIGVVALGASWRAHQRVTLYEDGIEVQSWFSVRQLKRSQILGSRMGKLAWQAGGSSYYIIVPSDTSTRELQLPAFLHVDNEFFSWMAAIPRLPDHGRTRDSR